MAPVGCTSHRLPDAQSSGAHCDNKHMSIRVGVIGGGQLARMMIAPATEIGISLTVLAETADAPAALAASHVGDYRDAELVHEFAKTVDIITFDHEHVPQEILRSLEADGHAVYPPADALQYAQDKLLMREKLQTLDLPQPAWARIETPADLESFIADNGGRAVVKTPRGGYDGKGVRVVSSAADVADWFENAPLLAEELVGFTRELAQQIARRPSGQTRPYPLVETVQRDGVCAEVIAPAPAIGVRESALAADIAERIADGLGIVGMLAVELFETDDGRILINELAMRPHNSGHWTQDGSQTSQFEQHLRAVADLALGEAEPRAPFTVMVNILGGPLDADIDTRFADVFAEHPAVKIHTYGKASRPGRKVGHINAFGDELNSVVYEARAAAAIFEN